MVLMKAKTQLDNGRVREVLNHTALLSPPIVSLPLTGSFPVMSPNHDKPPTRPCTDQTLNTSCKSLHEAEGGPKQQPGNKKGASFPPTLESSESLDLFPLLLSLSTWATEERTSNSDATVVPLGEAKKLPSHKDVQTLAQLPTNRHKLPRSHPGPPHPISGPQAAHCSMVVKAGTGERDSATPNSHMASGLGMPLMVTSFTPQLSSDSPHARLSAKLPKSSYF